jgi:hypothetical protein
LLDSVRALLDSVVDYAGLFPPAGLDMARAVDDFGCYRRRPDAWMLGRFIVSAARLEEFGDAVARQPAAPGDVWRLSALGTSDVAATVAAVQSFNANHQRAMVDTLELKADSPQQIETARQQIPEGLAAYFEMPSSADPAPLVEALVRSGARAKIRTGGLTAGAIPPATDVARFIRRCDEAKVPFKATAGLHHPIRGGQRLTYEQDSPSAKMHGFLNVFLAAAFLWSGISAEEMTAILETETVQAFRFDRKGIGWRGRWISTQQIAAARKRFAIAFGSCSFDEPVTELEANGLR